MENNIIEKIEITNFRSLHHVIINCKEINLFSGSNDAGKSNVLRALNLFFNNQTDFQRLLNFSDDFCKVELAKAQKSSKSKQLIKIRLYLKIPTGYSTLKSEKELFVEKIFDRENTPSIKYSNEANPKIKKSISRILNKIQFIYIPALKGENVIQYLLGLLGEYKLIDQKDIEDLNTKVNANTKDLTELLSLSKIAINTSFGLPVFLNDFWQKLSVGTLYENFDLLETSFGANAEAKLKKLNQVYYQIPLNFRGEGIKSKYIPPILQWLQEKNPNKIFIWGIDEPENSLEFRAAEELSNLFFNFYAQKNQIFITSHSLAFINPRSDVKYKPLLYRCLKGEFGTTIIKNFDDLFKDQEKNKLYTELGVLQVQHQIIEEWRKKEKDLLNNIQEHEEKIKEINKKIKAITKPLIITEGKTDWKHLKASLAYFKVNNLFNQLDVDFLEYEDIDMGESELEKMCDKYSIVNQPNKIIFIFDRDVEKHLKTKGDGKKYKKWASSGVYSFCIPIPSHRSDYTNIAIESFYQENDLKTLDDDGKSLFFTNEIECQKIISKDLTTGKSSINEVFTILDTPILANEFQKKVYDQDANQIVDKHGIPVAFSKSTFSDKIYNRIGAFANVDFTEFKAIFEIIETIVSD